MRTTKLHTLRRTSLSALVFSLMVGLVACDAPAEDATTDTAQLSLSESTEAPILECGTKTLIEDLCAGEAYWVSRAQEKCDSRGWKLTQYSLLSKCKAKGKYGYSDIKFQCCGETAPEPEIVEPEIVEPESTIECATAEIVNDTCGSEESWVAQAQQKCATRGWKLSQYSLMSKCKDSGKYGYSNIKFQCCGIAETVEPEVIEPGDTAACFVDDIVSETCMGEGALLAEAASICGDNGADVAQVALGSPCKAKGKYGYQAIKFECCETPVDSIDDVTTIDDVDAIEEVGCWEAAKGSDDTCLPAEVFENGAMDACSNQGQVLTQFGLSTQCKTEKGTPGYRFAKFQCCDKEAVEVDDVEEVEEADACWAASMGGVSVCFPEVDFAIKAKAACGAKGQILTQFGVASACKTKKGAGYRFAKFQCCDPVSDDGMDAGCGAAEQAEKDPKAADEEPSKEDEASKTTDEKTKVTDSQSKS